ncbi:hypothetical protein AVEN_256905-1 [Araneus ventricosus]|uniref:Secreted protein n=1 Tax=Araneus ventricosus TaxID=182803 RepID=A0A4Y2CG18_ARAVE|nr:hypothetical protein AVEN_256905-1 [Araneus ventricosus]
MLSDLLIYSLLCIHRVSAGCTRIPSPSLRAVYLPSTELYILNEDIRRSPWTSDKALELLPKSPNQTRRRASDYTSYSTCPNVSSSVAGL